MLSVMHLYSVCHGKKSLPLCSSFYRFNATLILPQSNKLLQRWFLSILHSETLLLHSLLIFQPIYDVLISGTHTDIHIERLPWLGVVLGWVRGLFLK